MEPLDHEAALQRLEQIAKLGNGNGDDSKKRAAAIEALVGEGFDADGVSQTDRLVKLAIAIVSLRQMGVIGGSKRKVR